MSGQHKTQIVAGGIILVTLTSATITGLATDNFNVGMHALKLAFTSIFAFSLIQRASWARWLVGILAMVSVAMTAFLILDWHAFKLIIQAWLGAWMLPMAAFHAWVTYTLLLDRKVIEHFRGDSETQRLINQEAEQASAGNP